jgi:hypothetical protein
MKLSELERVKEVGLERFGWLHCASLDGLDGLNGLNGV